MSQLEDFHGFKFAASFTASNEAELRKNLKFSKKQLDLKWNQEQEYSVKRSDFEVINAIGEGGYGNVFLVRHITARDKNNLPYYAMKMMKKRVIIQRDGLKFISSEKKILQSVDFCFIIKHFFSFKDKANLYLITEYMPGGDLFELLMQNKRFEESSVKFYVAQIVLAFEYLHFMGIIHRDLKPQNIVLGRDGFVKIVDFGISKKIDNNRTQTICGTPAYRAPEMIKFLPYSYGVDWWAVGILIFQLSDGDPPYFSSDIRELSQQILNNQIQFRDHFSPRTKKVIQDLTKVDPNERLSNVEAVKKHEFFRQIDWIKMFNKEVKAPFVPKVTIEGDTSNVYSREIEEMAEDSEDWEDVYEKEFENF